MPITDEAVQSWVTWLRAAGRPETTIGLRTYHVLRVFHGTERDPWTITTQDLIDYLAAQSWAPETRRSCRASLRSFYAWAQATGRRLDSPAHQLPSIKVPRALPRPTPERIYHEAVLKARERERLMIHLAAVCGLRCSEISRVRREDVIEDLVGRSLVVRGKGGHVRNVPLPDDLAAQLLGHPPGWVFPGQDHGHLSPHYVGKLVSRLLPAGWTCHTLRHRCATVAYAATHDLRAVQELLGHAKPETTAIYTLVPVDSVRAAIRATSA